MELSFDVSGKAVLVVGGNSGIGAAVAQAFALAGSEVTILSEVEGVHEAAEEMERVTDARIGSRRCDITDRVQIAAALDGMDQIDVLVNNAGISPPDGTPVVRQSSGQEFARVLDVNVTGLFSVTQLALPLMDRGARIIFTASIWAKTGGSNHAGYVASKHAVLGMVRTLAAELGSMGITVNAICPGTTNTPTAQQWSKETLDEIASTMVIHNEAILEPEHLAGAYVFLASPAASEITGQALNVDRGQVMV